MRPRCITNMEYKNNYLGPSCLLVACIVRHLRARIVRDAGCHASSRTMTTTNFTKCCAFHDHARSGSFLDDEETERRADRKFKWDLRRSLARESIVITGADRATRLIWRTIYDGPAARDRSRRSLDELGIENWSGAAKRGFQVCCWKWQTFRFALRRSRADIAISHCNLNIFYALFAENSKRLSGTREWSVTLLCYKCYARGKLDRNETKNNFNFFLNIEWKERK